VPRLQWNYEEALESTWKIRKSGDVQSRARAREKILVADYFSAWSCVDCSSDYRTIPRRHIFRTSLVVWTLGAIVGSCFGAKHCFYFFGGARNKCTGGRTVFSTAVRKGTTVYDLILTFYVNRSNQYGESKERVNMQKRAYVGSTRTMESY
jgi:hypothetical protein